MFSYEGQFTNNFVIIQFVIDVPFILVKLCVTILV